MAHYTDSTDVEFEWDEAKSAQCLPERGFDFVYAVRYRVIRIISARKANAREIGKHGNRKDPPEA
ncbi:hypothetical protein [Azospirillum sp. sgz301742]